MLYLKKDIISTQHSHSWQMLRSLISQVHVCQKESGKTDIGITLIKTKIVSLPLTQHTDVLNFIVTIIFTFTCKNSLARLW